MLKCDGGKVPCGLDSQSCIHFINIVGRRRSSFDSVRCDYFPHIVAFNDQLVSTRHLGVIDIDNSSANSRQSLPITDETCNWFNFNEGKLNSMTKKPKLAVYLDNNSRQLFLEHLKDVIHWRLVRSGRLYRDDGITDDLHVGRLYLQPRRANAGE